jgi:hypothetical protein
MFPEGLIGKIRMIIFVSECEFITFLIGFLCFLLFLLGKLLSDCGEIW